MVDLSTSDQRRNVHRSLAEAWKDVPERQAWHLAQAADDPDEPDEQIAALLENVAATIGRRGDGPAAMAALLALEQLSQD